MKANVENVEEADNDVKNIMEKGIYTNKFGFYEYKSSLPFVTDMNLKLVVTHGIEAKGITAVPIPRKVNKQNLKLDSYQFIANEENNAIEEVDRKEIMEYIKVCIYFLFNNNEGLYSRIISFMNTPKYDKRV